MDYRDWNLGDPIGSPVYLDANLLVGAVVSKHRLYTKTAQLMGELLAGGTQILVSLLGVQESLWALARLSYCDMANQRQGATFTQSIYNKWRDRIFQSHGPRMEAVPSMLRDWSDAGVPLAVVPAETAGFVEISDLTPAYMRQYKLTPADAAHLALAQKYAHTFLTADSDFEQVAQQAASHPLTILHLSP